MSSHAESYREKRKREDAQEFGEVVAQAGVCISELISYAHVDSVRNQDKVKNEFYRLGVKFHDWIEGGKA